MVQASAEKLEHTEPAEKERVTSPPQREQLAITPSRPSQKEMEQKRQSRVPNREGGETQGEREPHLDKGEGDQSESMERVKSTVKEDRFLRREGG